MDPQLVDPSVRLRGFPSGWFVVEMAGNVPAGSAKSMRYFDRELVAFRSPDGRLAVVTACCPALGTSAATDAPVVDDHGVFCPVHGFRVGHDGAIHGEATPHRRRLCLPVSPLAHRERNGMIFVHYDRQGRAPSYEIPELPEAADVGWAPWTVRLLELRTHPREVVENVVDSAHFLPVHRNRPLRFENEFDGVRAIQRSEGTGTEEHATTGYRLEAIYYGPGYQITRMDSVVPTILVNAHTMVREDLLHLRFGLMIPANPVTPYPDDYVRFYVATLMNGFKQDAAIWEHKVYRDRPVLCDGDGPIEELRRWYAQFFD